MRDEEEIQAMADLAAETETNSKFPSMTYEQGLRAGLEWVLNPKDPDSPMD